MALRKDDFALRRFFEPDAVAVIGASPQPSKLGYAVLKNLVDCGYSRYGKIYPIHPNSKEILGFRAYPSVLDIPGRIDLAVVVVPYRCVPDVLRSCGQKGIPAAAVISAGFREVGPEGLERELELAAIARECGIRIIGPNSLGVIDTFTPLNITFAAGVPPGGPIAFASQSGALGAAILCWAEAGHQGFSKFVSLGNKVDVNEVDLLRAWAEDRHTRVILLYSEELTNGQEFICTARQVTRRKPVLIIKSGGSQAGARAVSSHTGALAGSDQAYTAAFRQAGIIQASSLEELLDMALAFAYQPLLKGNRIAILTNAGGPAILATDALERAGLQIARFSADTRLDLQACLPDAAGLSNPVDVLGDASPERYASALEIIARDPHVDGLLAVLVPQALLPVELVARAVAAVSKSTSKPLLACFMGEKRMAAGIEILSANSIPNYPFPERAAQAFKALAEYQAVLARPAPEFTAFEVDRAAVRTVIQAARAGGRLAIGETEGRRILQAYGLAIPESELADTPDCAARIARTLGYPVVLKVASPDILHKTDIGGVKVGLKNDQEVRAAFELIQRRAQRQLPNARLWGCLVQQMAPAGGLELLVGMSRDAQFGPLVTFGLGGIYVEALKDVTFRVAPFSRQEAEDMLKEIRSHLLLDGVRGQPAVDKEAIVSALLRVGQLCLDFPEIAELDINPLLVYPSGQGVLAIDMRLVLAKAP